jgi:hypothetical protein
MGHGPELVGVQAAEQRVQPDRWVGLRRCVERSELAPGGDLVE